MDYAILFLVCAGTIVILGAYTFFYKNSRLILDYLRSSFSNSKKGQGISLLVDIGSGSVAVAFALFKVGQLPKILSSIRLPFTVTEKPDAENLLQNMSGALDQLLEETIISGFHPSSILITFSSPWFVSKTKHINIAETTPFLITENFLQSISAKEEQAFSDELKGDTGQDSFEVVEKSIIHTKINGYTLDSSIGRQTNVFDAFLYLSLVPKHVIDRMSDIIFKHTHVTKDRFIIHTFPLVSFSVIRDVFNTTSDFLIMDVTREVTDLTLVRDNILMQTVSFPYGGNSIVRAVAKAFNVTPEIAESTLRIYNSNKAEDAVVTKMQEVLAGLEKEWAGYFGEAIARFSEKQAVPVKLYVTSDNDVEPLFAGFLKSFKLDIVYIDSETFNQFYQADEQNFSDQFIAILAIFYRKFLTS